MKHIIIIVVLTIAVAVTYLSVYLGAFRSVDITEAPLGPYKIIFLEHAGAYHKIVEKIERVESWAKAQGLNCSQTFGEYFDNPEKIEEDRLQSRGGCFVDQKPANLPAEFGYAEVPAKKYVIAKFEGSPAIGPMKVYPKVFKYIDEHRFELKSAVIEMYEVLSPTEMKTTYLFAIH